MTDSPELQIFLIEDNPGDARLIEEYLKDEFGQKFSLAHVQRLDEACEALMDNDHYNVLLCDLSLPDSSGYETFLKMYREHPQIPMIVLTGQSDEHVGTQAVKVGAQDFLTKETLNAPILKRSILYAIERSRAQKISQFEIIEGQEQERKRIAEELHNGVGQILSAINLNLKSLEPTINKMDEEDKTSYQNALQLLEQATREVRSISRNLMPDVLEKFGLVKALEQLCDDMNQGDKLQIRFQHNDINHRFRDEIEITVYRVAQELLHNLHKYARASRAEVQLIDHDEKVTLMVEDNGQGFDYDQVTEQNRGMGLINIEKRVKSLDGNFILDSKRGKGTTVTVELPVN